MPKIKKGLPKYCKFSHRNQAYYSWKGKKHPLPGAYGSQESYDAYHLRMAKLLEMRASENEHILELQNSEMNQLTVADLVALKLADGKTHYVMNGRDTGTCAILKRATKIMLKDYGDWDVVRFTQKELNLVIGKLQQQKKKNGQFISVNHVNRRRDTIISIFNWGYKAGHITFDIPERLKLSKKVEEGISLMCQNWV